MLERQRLVDMLRDVWSSVGHDVLRVHKDTTGTDEMLGIEVRQVLVDYDLMVLTQDHAAAFSFKHECDATMKYSIWKEAFPDTQRYCT